MPRFYKYNVYDNGELILENVERRVVVQTLGCGSINIPSYAERKVKYQDRYTFEIIEKDNLPKTGFEKEWEDTVNLFKNVIWVKEGGRRLCVSKL